MVDLSDAAPLTAAEVAELDGYGELTGAQLLGIRPAPRRAMELWEREILFGSSATKHLKGILGETSPFPR